METTNTEPKTKWAKPIILLATCIIIFGVLFTMVLNAYHKEGETRTAWLKAGADQATVADRLDVSATVQSIDPVKGEMVVRLDFFPQGNLASKDGLSAAEDLSIMTNSSLKPEINFKKGQKLMAVDIVVGLYDGLYTDYPFDHHSTELQIYASVIPPPVKDVKQEEEYVPVNVELFGFVHGFKLEGKASKESAADFASIEVQITRSGSTTIWAVFIMVLLWLMALAVVGVTFFVLTSKRKLEFGAFGWMGAMLFAFVSFRSAAPGVPPIGSLIDFMSFFWAEFIVAICLVLMVTVYLIRQPK